MTYSVPIHGHASFSAPFKHTDKHVCVLGNSALAQVMLVVKKLSANAEGDSKRHRFDPWAGKTPEEGVATHSSVLAWRIPSPERSRGPEPCKGPPQSSFVQILGRTLP